MSRKSFVFGVGAALATLGVAALVGSRPWHGAGHVAISKKPRLVFRAAPNYPQEARLARIDASVLIVATVGEDGALRNIAVSRGAGLGFDESAVAAAGRWRFTPAESAGKPVPVIISAVVRFELPERDVPTGSLTFDLPKGAARPRLIAATTLTLPLGGGTVDATLNLDAKGRVVRARGASDLAGVSDWRFTPATLHGKPIEVSGRLHLYPAR